MICMDESVLKKLKKRMAMKHNTQQNMLSPGVVPIHEATGCRFNLHWDVLS